MKTKIFKAKLKDLKPTENNPRQISKDDFRKLKKSLQEFPEMEELREIVVDEDMRILGGKMMIEIIKMRKEWKKKYGNTRMFDHYYMGLRDRVGKSWLCAMKEAQALGAKLAHHSDKTKRTQIGLRAMDVYVNEWGEIERNIEEAEKNTWLYKEEER